MKWDATYAVIAVATWEGHVVSPISFYLNGRNYEDRKDRYGDWSALLSENPELREWVDSALSLVENDACPPEQFGGVEYISVKSGEPTTVSIEVLARANWCDTEQPILAETEEQAMYEACINAELHKSKLLSGCDVNWHVCDASPLSVSVITTEKD